MQSFISTNQRQDTFLGSCAFASCASPHMFSSALFLISFVDICRVVGAR